MTRVHRSVTPSSLSHAPWRLVLVLCLSLGVAATAAAQPAVSDQVRNAIARTGAASIVVGIEVPSFAFEGRLTVPEAAAQQIAIREAVDAVLASVPRGLAMGRRFERIPYFSARVDGEALVALASARGVVTIEPDVPEAVSLADSVPLVNAPAAWAAGSTGSGWRVAVLDTGVQTSHQFLAGKTVAEACYSNGGGGGLSVCPGGVSSSTATGSGVQCGVNGCNHGTHVAGIAVGASASPNGVAPGAGLIAMQVFTRFDSGCGSTPAPCALSYVSDQIAALERVLVLAGPGNANQIASANMSLGGGQYFDQASCDAAHSARKAAIDNLRSIGIATVISSGNSGYTDSLSAPGCISSAISVGSTTRFDAVSQFTNRAPFLSLMAPGQSIVSSVPVSGWASFSGTSMAAPHVAGAWAVLKQSRPNATVTEILNAVRSAGVSIADPLLGIDSAQAVYPRLDVSAARTALFMSLAPGQPMVTSAAASAGLLTVAWTSGAGGAPATHRLDFFLASSLVATVNTGPGTSAGIPIPLGTVGTFTVRVTATNPAGSSPTSAPFAFSIGVGAPGQPTVTAASASGAILTVSWMPGAGPSPTSHALRFFSGAALVGAIRVGPANSVALAIPAGTTGNFTVDVTAFNGTVAGPASSPFAFTIGPSCTVPASPTVSGGVTGGTASVSWPAVPGATSYILSAGTAPGGTQYLAPTNIGASTGTSASGLPSGFQAWVRVIAVNACSQSAASDFLVR